MEAPLSYYQLRKRAATWLRCGTLSSLILTLAGVSMIILGIQGTPASYNIKWIGIAASASGGSLLLLLLLISLIMASFCPQDAGTSLQLQLQQGLSLPPPCPPSHHHLHAHQHAMSSGASALTPTSRHSGRASIDGMPWMVYYQPSKHQQLEHSILYPVPGFAHPVVGGTGGVHSGAQWAWRPHHTTIQPPPQYSSLYPDPNGNCTGPTTCASTSATSTSVGNSNQEATTAATPTTASSTTPTEHRPIQRPQRLSPPLLLRCSPSSDRHVHHHHHHSHCFHGQSGSPSHPQQSRTPSPGQGPSCSMSPGQGSNTQDRRTPTDLQGHHQLNKSPSENHPLSHLYHHRPGQVTPPLPAVFRQQHPHHLPLKLSPPASTSQCRSSSRRSFHSSLPASPLLDHVDETRETSDHV
ncbi:uncharacterized protein [Diadema antillarum]|uniref:uncharacterized protein n=1 Tax=Diadema antillarum TaxID=105358 RepID=UPI003A883DD8